MDEHTGREGERSGAGYELTDNARMNVVKSEQAD